MNIFASDNDPILSAMALDDKRVVKMILESTQLLCTAINLHGGSTPYKSTHVNHPSNIWTRQNKKNWEWLLVHATALCEVYSNVYNKKHKCESILTQLANDINILPDGDLQPFANCTVNKPKEISYKHLENSVEAYKAYLSARWDTDSRQPTWTNRNKPEWYKGKYA